MKIIQTIYKGHHFRSRLEARWAVFFDMLGVKYEYEPEGYVLEKGGCYLPDFYLLNFNAFFEVKHIGIIGTKEGNDAENKLDELFSGTGRPCMIAYGEPKNNIIKIRCLSANLSGGGWWKDWVTIGLDPDTHEPYLHFYEDDRRDNDYYDGEWNKIRAVSASYLPATYYVQSEVYHARYVASMARFEYGETPYIAGVK